MIHDLKTVKISIRLPESTYLKLREYCDRYGMGISRLIRMILETWMNRANK